MYELVFDNIEFEADDLETEVVYPAPEELKEFWAWVELQDDTDIPF